LGKRGGAALDIFTDEDGRNRDVANREATMGTNQTASPGEKDICLLCPGQGAQVVGMGKDLAQASAAAREVFELADATLHNHLSEVCFNGPADRLNRTEVAQAAIFTTSVASYRAAVEAGIIRNDRVSMLAGLSLGEYTALHLAGCFSFQDGLRLVAARGRYMDQAGQANPGTMVSLVGADDAAAQALCEETAQGEVLVLANFNAPGQVVASGTVGACKRLAAAAEAKGFRAIPLVVSGAFHSALMKPADRQMAEELNRVTIEPAARTVFSNVTAQPHGDAASIKRLLVEQIVSPVRWEQTMAPLAKREDLRFVELAPGKVLAGLLRRQNRRVVVESVATAEALVAEARN
jgi:[acyl-carrier-protein] S-malonyltransferase